MGFFDQRALQDGVSRREVFAWAGYDFANSGYTTVVITAVFNAYFVAYVAANATWATFLWTLILAISNLAVMLTLPTIGIRIDAQGTRKPWLLGATLLCVASIVGLYWVGAGDIALAALLIVISNYCFSLGETLCAAYLPELARPEALGRVSGWGWSFGYVGGMVSLGLSLAWVSWVQGQGGGAAAFVPGTMLITAGIYFLAALPMFLWVRERAEPRAQPTSRAVYALTDWRRVWLRIRAFPDFRRFLLVGFFFYSGVSVVITVTAIYADQVLNFQPDETMTLFFLVNIAAALGAFFFGYLEDRIGHKAALMSTLSGWIGVVALAVWDTSRPAFWGAAALAGICMGTSQSAGRALTGAMAPVYRLGEFFGLWGFATRCAAIIGPLTYGLISWASAGNHRYALLGTGFFFVAALVLLLGVDMRRSVERARQDDLAEHCTMFP
ncbi:MAG: MFS transporter [Lautropia sp.]|nr:MFS transporter [Lautropia sp.]